MTYSIIIPCYKSSLTIVDVVRTTHEELCSMGLVAHEFILVNDGSPDDGQTEAVLRRLAEGNNFITFINLAKNAGQHNAIMAGLNHAHGDYIICMDDDGQTHPSQLRFLFDEMEKGYDVVYGYYPQKKHSFIRNFGSKFNSFSIRLLIGAPKSLHLSSYFVMKKFVRDSIITYTNSYSYMQGLVLRTTRNISCVPIQHFERAAGQSTYTFKALIRLWSSIMGFSIVPLRLTTYLGYLFSALGILGAITVIICKICVPAMEAGWPSLMVTICFFSGLNLLFLGLVGEYVGRMFLGVNREPQYVIKEIVKKR